MPVLAKRTETALPGASELAGIVNGLASPGDLVVCLGAGNITQWAHALPEELALLRRPQAKAAR